MTASFAASFAMFIVSIVAVYLRHTNGITGDVAIDALLYLSILANVLYFFAFGILAERDETFQKFLSKRRGFEWPLRVFSNMALLAVPLALDANTSWFLAAMFGFYIVLLAWDAVVYSGRPKEEAVLIKNVTGLDALGFAATALLSLGISIYDVSKGKTPPLSIVSSISSEATSERAMIVVGVALAIYTGAFFCSIVVVGPSIFRNSFRTFR